MLSAETIIIIKDILSWVLPSTLGVATKLAFESNTKKITFKRIITSLIIGFFVGYAINALADKYNLIKTRGIAIAFGAVLSEHILVYLFKNAPTIIKNVFSKTTLLNDNDKKEGDNNV